MTIREQFEVINTTLCRTNELYGKWAKSQGMNYNSMMVLYAINRKSKCTQKQICEGWLLPKQTVNTILKELHQKGYVKFETEEKDKREKWIQFTEQGRAHANKVLNKLYEMEEHAIEKMGPELSKMLIKSNQRYCELFEEEVQNELFSG